MQFKQLKMKPEQQSTFNRKLARDFVNQIWNEKRFDNLPNLVTDHFIDHSQPYTCVKNREGLKLYLEQLGKHILHHSIIKRITSLDDLVIVRICMQTSLLNTVSDRPKEEMFEIVRMFKIKNTRIAEHWEIILEI